MQKTKVAALLAALLSVSGQAWAADAKVAAASASLTEKESVVEADPYAGKTTIGRLAEKQKRLAELKLDAEIEEVIEKKKSAKSKANEGGSVAVPLPAMNALPATGSMQTSSGTKVTVDEDMQLSAIYGRSKDLKAEMLVDGKTITVSKGSQSIPGWTVTSITNDRIALSGNKKTKTIYLSGPKASGSDVADTLRSVLPAGIPGLPMPSQMPQSY